MRVSTYGNYQSALLDLMAAQSRGADANKRYATQKNATDLAGFGREAETLTALQATATRIQGFVDTGDAVAARLERQDLAMDRMAEGILGARDAIANAVASGRLEGVMQELQTHFQVTLDSLNTRHQNAYVFSGGAVDTPPVAIKTLEELADLPVAADAFQNGQLKTASRLDESTSVETSFLANELGEEVFDLFRQIQLTHEATPLDGGAPDPATEDFLKDMMLQLNTAYDAVINEAARNGNLQNRVDSVLDSHRTQLSSLEVLVGSRTDADMAQAVTDMEAAQIAMQASGQVLSELRYVSLLNYLD